LHHHMPSTTQTGTCDISSFLVAHGNGTGGFQIMMHSNVSTDNSDVLVNEFDLKYLSMEEWVDGPVCIISSL